MKLLTVGIGSLYIFIRTIHSVEINDTSYERHAIVYLEKTKTIFFEKPTNPKPKTKKKVILRFIQTNMHTTVVQCRTLDLADNFHSNTPSEKSPIFGRRKRDDHLSR